MESHPFTRLGFQGGWKHAISTVIYTGDTVIQHRSLYWIALISLMRFPGEGKTITASPEKTHFITTAVTDKRFFCGRLLDDWAEWFEVSEMNISHPIADVIRYILTCQVHTPSDLFEQLSKLNCNSLPLLGI